MNVDVFQSINLSFLVISSSLELAKACLASKAFCWAALRACPGEFPRVQFKPIFVLLNDCGEVAETLRQEEHIEGKCENSGAVRAWKVFAEPVNFDLN